MSQLETYWDFLCLRTDQFLLIFLACCVGLPLTLISILFVDLNRATEVIVIVNLIGLLVFAAVTGVITLRCRRRS